MKIDDNHLYHGAALIQIAEDSHFTAINRLGGQGATWHDAFRVNADIGVLLKYSSSPRGQVKAFNFTGQQLAQLESIATQVAKVFVALVCVKDREICCLTLNQLNDLVLRRKNWMKRDERQYVVLVILEKGRNFRVYIGAPRKKRTRIGEFLIVARNGFPRVLFQ